MSVILDWVKDNAKDGANLAEFEDILSGKTIDSIDSKEKALKLFYENKLMKAAFDSEISKKVQNHDDRFREEKLPGLLEAERERLRSELNPQETPEQREMRELRSEMAKIKAERDMATLKDKLRARAKDLNYDPERAAKLAIIGDFDKANSMMEEQAEYLKTALDTERTKIVNQRLGGEAPTGGETIETTLTEANVDSWSIADIEREFSPGKHSLKGNIT